MIVRNNLRESANQSRLLSGNKLCFYKIFVHFGRNERAHCAFAFAAIKIASIVKKNFTRAACASINGRFGRFFIDTITDANDHENSLQLNENDCQSKLRVIRVKNFACVVSPPGPGLYQLAKG